MSFDEVKRNEIKLYLLRKIQEDDEFVISKVADAFGISMTSVKRYIETEIANNHICKDIQKKCKYDLVYEESEKTYDLSVISEREDGKMFRDFLPFIDANENAVRIWGYVLPEICNNAIEHSNGKKVRIIFSKCILFTKVTIVDDGIGAFKNIMNYKKKNGIYIEDLKESVLELYKGRFTTSPEKHSGEGIFFSTKLLDKMAIVSDGVVFKTGFSGDYSLINSHLLSYAMKFINIGTVVVMELENETKRKTIEIFNEYSDIDEGIIKTVIPVFEACNDGNPVARSQARRITERLERFKEVILDFNKCDIMAQGFSDELFRVFQNANPDIKLIPINMNEEVEWMYLHAIHYKP